MASRLWQIIIGTCIIFGAWFLSWLLTNLLWKIISRSNWHQERKEQLPLPQPSVRLDWLAGICPEPVRASGLVDPIVGGSCTLVLFGIFGALYRGAELFSEFINSFSTAAMTM